MRLLRIIISKVKEKFSKHPLLCNCLMYGGLYTLSETGQQTIIYKITEDEPKPYDTATIARYAVMGTMVLPNIMFHWYRWLDRRFPATSAAIIAKKMVLDQCVMAPPTLATFYVGMSLMEGKKDIFEECRQKLLPTWITASAFWLPVQAINFLFVPATARVVYVSCCCLVWDNVMCILKRAKIKTATESSPDNGMCILKGSKINSETESSPDNVMCTLKGAKIKTATGSSPDNIMRTLKRAKINSETESSPDGAIATVGTAHSSPERQTTDFNHSSSERQTTDFNHSSSERRIKEVFSSERHILSPSKLLKTNDNCALQLNTL